MLTRLIVTGARSWSDPEIVRRALVEALDAYDTCGHGLPVLVHGARGLDLEGDYHQPLRGPDAIADHWWRLWGLPVERHFARRYRDGRAAEGIRDRGMMRSGADLCLAFVYTGTAGTDSWAAVTLAEQHRIPSRLYFAPAPPAPPLRMTRPPLGVPRRREHALVVSA